MDPDVLAGLVLAVDLEPRPRSRRWAVARLWLTAAFRALVEDSTPPEITGALIVTRLDNGATVQLTSSDAEDGQLLAYVRRQLAELTVAEFLDRWGIDPDTLTAAPS